jgi:hypothetical protein
MSFADINNQELNIIIVRRVQFLNVPGTGREGGSGVAGHDQANRFFAAEVR